MVFPGSLLVFQLEVMNIEYITSVYNFTGYTVRVKVNGVVVNIHPQDNYNEDDNYTEVIADYYNEWEQFHEIVPYKEQTRYADEHETDGWNIENDALIVFMADAFCKHINVPEINLYPTNVFWALHDIYHAIHHVDAYQVYVDEHIENTTNLATIDFMYEHNLNIEFDTLNFASQSMSGRFMRHYDYNEYYMEKLIKEEEE